MSQKPSRAAAIFLTLFGAGVGHAYVGLPKRAIAWFVGVLVVEVSFAALLIPVGKSIGFGLAFISFLVALLVALLAPMIDLARLAPTSFHTVPRWVPFVFWIVTSLIGGGARFFIRADLVEAFKIPSGGMMPTLLLGDHLFCDKHAYASAPPARGEAMVFAFPENPGQDFIQRSIAVAGDKLEVRGGHPWINDWEVPHCALGNAQLGTGDDQRSGIVEVEFLDGHAYLTFYDATAASPDLHLGPFMVQDGDTWTLGDNRFNSHDSPRWRDGLGQGVPRELVKGRAAFVWLRSSDAGVDLSRFGTSLLEPTLPASMHDLAPAFTRCMQSAPPYEKTVPPKH